MQKNTVITLLSVVGFIFLWDTLVVSRYSHRPPNGQTATVATSSGTNKAEMDVAINNATSFPATPAGPSGADHTVSLSAPGTEVVFLTGGARVGSWRIQEKNAWLEMVMPQKSRNTSPLETFPDVAFSARKTSEGEVVFTGLHPSGFIITKTVTLSAQPPFHRVSLTFTNTTANEISLNAALGWGNGLDKHHVDEPYVKDKTAGEASAVAMGAAKARRWRPGLAIGRTVDLTDAGKFDWVGVDNHHFLAALVAPDGASLSKIHVHADRDFAPVAGVVIDGRLKPGETLRQDYLLYVGPKSSAGLKAAGHNLIESIDFGLFGFISRGLLKALTFFHSLTGNWGWAIVLLTLSLQLCMFPLTKRSLEHSVKMRELQPHLKKLQDQHKEDPKRYQVEMMNFYRKQGMKFMGLEGCLPVLLQMPVFFAFYTALNNAYDLRGAPWIFWITDLGVKDPHYVLPVIMGIGMFLQSKLSGATMDPAQQKMMMVMPVMFTFMFLSMPSGLVLYWCVNSLVTIVVQRILTYTRRHQPVIVA